MISISQIEERFLNCKITDVDAAAQAAFNIKNMKSIYEQVCPFFPWWVVGILHYRECHFDFSRHLHNGDSLAARTRRFPPNRPSIGSPPFTWEESARDALSDRKPPFELSMGSWLDWFERYNGLGYRRRDTPSPYVWACTDVYKSGLYVADGKFDPSAVDANLGCAAILKSLVDSGDVCFDQPNERKI